MRSGSIPTVGSTRISILTIALLFSGAAAGAQEVVFHTLAGSTSGGGLEDGVGSSARFSAPESVTVCPNGIIFVADTGNHAIRRVTPTGVVTTFAGMLGVSGSVDGTGGAARFNLPSGIDSDGACNLFVADMGNHTIRRITPSGVVTTLAGSPGQSGSSNGQGSGARFDEPRDVAVDGDGNVYVADHQNHTIRAITGSGSVSTWAGSAGSAGRVNGSRSSSRLNLPWKLDARGGTLYVTEMGNRTIRRVTAGAVEEALDGFDEVGQRMDVTFTSSGAVYFCDLELGVVRRLASGFPIVAGAFAMRGHVDGPALDARFFGPAGIASFGEELMIVETASHDLRRFVNDEVSTLAGSVPMAGDEDGVGLAARFTFPSSLAIDDAGNLYVGESGRLREVTPIGVTSTIATGLESLDFLAAGKDGSVYASNFFGHAITRVAPDGTVSTFAGLPGTPGLVNGTGTEARLRNPRGLAVGSDGTIYVGDAGNGAIRSITPSGSVSTFRNGVGPATNLVIDENDSLYFVTEGSPAVLKRLDQGGVLTNLLTISDYHDVHEPRIARAPDGTFYVIDVNIHSIRRITGDGTTEIFAGDDFSPGNRDGAGDEARFDLPRAILYDEDRQRLYVADTGNNAIRYGSSVAPVVIESFEAFPVFVPPGQTTMLQWRTSGATSVRIDPLIGQVSPNGTLTLGVDVTTTLFLTATGPGGEATASLTIFVGEAPGRRRPVGRPD